MKRPALRALVAGAALAVACGRSPAAAETARVHADGVHDGYLGSGNHHDATTAVRA
jgi:hypothetical protein